MKLLKVAHMMYSDLNDITAERYLLKMEIIEKQANQN